jgi:hypothetical protein
VRDAGRSELASHKGLDGLTPVPRSIQQAHDGHLKRVQFNV